MPTVRINLGPFYKVSAILSTSNPYLSESRSVPSWSVRNKGRISSQKKVTQRNFVQKMTDLLTNAGLS